MCLSLTVILPDEKQKDADVIAKNASTDKIKASKEKRWFGRPSRFLFIASEVDSCACDLLTDNADWNDETWDIIPSYLPHIASILTNIHQQISYTIKNCVWYKNKNY